MKFNADTAPQPTARDSGPLPDGTYTVKVEQATELDNKSGTGRYLELVLVVIEGPHRGRKLWARYTTEHQSAKAQEIGLGQVSELSRALGRPAWDHESELQELVADVRVGRQKDNAERNEVKGWQVSADAKRVPTYTRPHQAAAIDVSRRNQQLAEVTQANAGRPSAPVDFDDDLPF
jgi:hypothetical protein